ncbi:MAG: glycosyltransferase, exosortase A system-associated [Magnetococcales bacterium]|nr:glycosyltransferase, exosortase A system-associated [Magnetococcales bacterium]
MRILHILDHSAPLQSGYVSRTLAILRQQRAMGWETAQLTGPKHPATLPEEEAEGLLFHRTPRTNSVLTQVPVLKQLAVIAALQRRLLELARSWRPDLLHAHSPVLNGLAALHVGRKLHIPVVYEIRAFWEDAAASHGTARAHGFRYRLTRAMETYVMRHAQAVTVICEGLRREVTARGIDPKKITAIPNAVEIERFSSHDGTMPTLPGIQVAQREIIGYIGSFYAYEGLALLLEAMPAIRMHRPDILLLLVGGGPEEARLRQMTTALGLESCVHFTGRLPPEAIPGYYALIDVLIFPRLPMRLTHLVTPLKPLEAMAAQRLVLASDVEGHKELITHGQTGFLFPAGDASALTQAVISLLADRNSWEKVIQHATRFVGQERTWSACAQRYRGVYETLSPAGPLPTAPAAQPLSPAERLP